MSCARSPDREPPAALAIASYNVHRCVGPDRRWDVARVAAVLDELAADVIAIQELDSASWSELSHWSRQNGYDAVLGMALRTHRGEYGNALLTRLPVLGSERIDLCVGRREPRGAIDVQLGFAGQSVRIISSHFGLRAVERWRQARRVLRAIDARGGDVVLLLGDFNAWLPCEPAALVLNARLGRAATPRTFPTRLPLFSLDRIWCRPRTALGPVVAHLSPRSAVASDHLPVRAICSPTDRKPREDAERQIARR